MYLHLSFGFGCRLISESKFFNTSKGETFADINFREFRVFSLNSRSSARVYVREICHPQNLLFLEENMILQLAFCLSNKIFFCKISKKNYKISEKTFF